MVVEVVHAPHTVTGGQFVTVGAAGEIVADRGPRVAPVVALPDPLGGDIDAAGPMGAGHDGCVPVETFGRVAGFGLGLDVGEFHGAPVVAHHVADLPFEIADVGVVGVEGHPVAVGAERHPPVLAAHTVGVGGAGRAGQGAEVLGAAEDGGERHAVVDGHSVELRDRQVRHVAKRHTVVERLVEAGVAADE